LAEQFGKLFYAPVPQFAEIAKRNNLANCFTLLYSNLPKLRRGTIWQIVLRSCTTICFTKEVQMANHVYKKIELTGSSPTSIEEAVQNALQRASETIRNMRWFEVTETRGQIENNQIAHWQVTIKVGFTLDEPSDND
jgi:flavin-binding protein dodecin